MLGPMLVRMFRNCLKALAFLRFFQPFVIQLPLCQKMTVGCPVHCAALSKVRHFPAVPLRATG